MELPTKEQSSVAGPGQKGIKVCHFVEWADGNTHEAVEDNPGLHACNMLQTNDLADSQGLKPGERLARDLL
jgi:hypothetical protein